MFHSLSESIAVYNCPNKRVDGFAVYTNTVPAGAFRGYGLPQTQIAIEAAIDELARQLGISPYEMRRRNIVRTATPCCRRRHPNFTTCSTALTASTSASTSSSALCAPMVRSRSFRLNG